MSRPLGANLKYLLVKPRERFQSDMTRGQIKAFLRTMMHNSGRDHEERRMGTMVLFDDHGDFISARAQSPFHWFRFRAKLTPREGKTDVEITFKHYWLWVLIMMLMLGRLIITAFSTIAEGGWDAYLSNWSVERNFLIFAIAFYTYSRLAQHWVIKLFK